MKSFFKKNKHTMLLVVGLVILVLVIPFILNVLFKIPAPLKVFVAEWEAAAALSYYGEILSFLSTTALSILALWQNKKINEANERHTNLLEQMEREKSAPRFIVEKSVVLGLGYDLKLEITNVTDNIARNISLSNFKLIDEAGKVYWENEQVISIDYLGPLMKHPFELETKGISDHKDQLIFTISYLDIFDTKYEKKVVGFFVDDISLRFSCC